MLSVLFFIQHLTFLQRKWAHKTEIRQERWHIKKAENLKTIHTRVRMLFIYKYSWILVKILPLCILFLQNMILNRAIRSIPYDNWQNLLCFKEYWCLLVLYPRIWNLLWIRFTASIEKMERWSRDTLKVLYFCFIFGLKICKVQTYGTVLKNSTLNTLY